MKKRVRKGLAKRAWEALKKITVSIPTLFVFENTRHCEVCGGTLPQQKKHNPTTYHRFCERSCRRGRHNKTRMLTKVERKKLQVSREIDRAVRAIGGYRETA